MQKNDSNNTYNCKLGFDYEAKLIKNNKFNLTATYSEEEIEYFLTKDLQAINLGGNDIKKYVIMDDNKRNTRIYSFNNNNEIHITKLPSASTLSRFVDMQNSI